MVGGGPAADGAAAGLRDAGFQGPIVILAEERWAPYERPPLSKGYLTGGFAADRLPLRPAAQYEQLGVELRTGTRVAAIDLERRAVVVDHAVRLASHGTSSELSKGALAGETAVEPFDLLLIATGAEPVRLPEAAGAVYLRSRDDADRLRELLAEGRLSIVGAGFIGCEVAASARALGAEVTLIEALPVPLERVLGQRLGAWLAGVHRERGVELRTGWAGPLPEVPFLAAVGSRPRTELAEAAGIACDRGVLVDEVGRTGVEGVFAAGDCSRFWSPIYGTHVRVEHFQTAGRHGHAVGRAMAGQPSPFAEAPWFWSDQYDLNLQYAGAGLAWDEEVVRGTFGEPPFAVFQLAGGRLLAALGVNDHHTVSRARRLLEAGAEVSRDRLADPGFDLRRALP